MAGPRETPASKAHTEEVKALLGLGWVIQLVQRTDGDPKEKKQGDSMCERVRMCLCARICRHSWLTTSDLTTFSVIAGSCCDSELV